MMINTTLQQQTLSLSPSGCLYRYQLEDPIPSVLSQALQAVYTAFDKSEALGLITLVNARTEDTWSAILHFWQDFASLYVRQLCQISPEETDSSLPLDLPEQTVLENLLLRLPPMMGAEYCTTGIFARLWAELNIFVEHEATQLGGLNVFLNTHLSRWQQVGRVCFHLAENKKDSQYPFAFIATYASHLSKNSKVHYLPLNRALQEYAGAGNKQALIRLLKPIHAAAKTSAWVNDLLNSHDIYHPLRWTVKQAYSLLKSITSLEESGIVVRLPNWWKKRPKAQVQVSIGSANQGALDMQTILDFGVDVTVGDEKLSESELNRLLGGDSGLVSFRGQWIEVDKEKLQEALDHWKTAKENADNGLSFIEGMRLLSGAAKDLSLPRALNDSSVTEWSYVNAGSWLNDVLTKLRDPTSVKSTVPKKLTHATLRPYQQIGVNWLYFLTELGLGACLADDMGLGKTIQIIALLLLRQEANVTSKCCSLLVLPASLLANWKSELIRFAPSLTFFILHPSETSRQVLDNVAADPSALHRYDIVLTTYSTLWRQIWLVEQRWDRLILDEAQAIKNPNAKQTRTIKSLKANARIVLTGTPIENRVGDLWSLFDFLSPGLLGSVSTFKKFIKALNNQEPVNYEPLRKLVQPYILRRLKTDKRVINDLPDKTELKRYCGLTKLQTALYTKAVKELTAALKDEEVSSMQRKGLVINYLLKFKQICNHPSQALGHGDYLFEHSGKFECLRRLCEEISERQEKVLVFTQFKEMTKPLALFLETLFSRPGLILHGSTPIKERKKLVIHFQDETGPPFFVLSLKAGGTGLNLTAANHVIHFDRWWNPAVENQATDRAFRIGQKRNVLVHKLICQGTVEENIDLLIDNKLELSNDILSGDGSPALTELSNDELIDLVSLDLNKAQL